MGKEREKERKEEEGLLVQNKERGTKKEERKGGKGRRGEERRERKRKGHYVSKKSLFHSIVQLPLSICQVGHFSMLPLLLILGCANLPAFVLLCMVSGCKSQDVTPV